MKMLLPQSEIQVTLVLVCERCTTLEKEKLVLFHSFHPLCPTLLMFSQHFLCIFVSVLKAACYKSSPQLKRYLYIHTGWKEEGLLFLLDLV